jgi:hypothetical protein
MLLSSCRQASNPLTFTEAVRQADKVVLYEGLPHQLYESDSLEDERRTKPVKELNGYPFYQEPLTPTTSVAQRLSEILGDSATYQPFTGEKKCGGFHPDYVVEWHVGADRYRASLCFGCREVKLFGPGLEERHDLDKAAHKNLQELLKGYQKNRPAIKTQAKL